MRHFTLDTNNNKSVDVDTAEKSQRVLMKKEVASIGVKPIVDLGRNYLCQKYFRDIESRIKLSKKLNTADITVYTLML